MSSNKSCEVDDELLITLRKDCKYICNPGSEFDTKSNNDRDNFYYLCPDVRPHERIQSFISYS